MLDIYIYIFGLFAKAKKKNNIEVQMETELIWFDLI